MKTFHPTEWRFEHRNAAGVLLWDQDWTPNALADEGEQAMLDVYFRGAAAPTNFYVGLLNSTPTDVTTLATMTAEAAGSGYARQVVPATAVGFPTLALDAGDYRAVSTVETFTAAGGSIGPVTYAFLATTTDNTGKLVVYNALSQSRTLASGDSLDVTFRIKLA